MAQKRWKLKRMKKKKEKLKKLKKRSCLANNPAFASQIGKMDLNCAWWGEAAAHYGAMGVVVTGAVTGFGAGVAVIFDDKGSQEGSQQSVLVEEENESERVIHRHI
ncbi:hypothetical protein KQX54_018580 [Cotesia glomerata]|uniref:Uncharacterized protein n=1 Tax=Cotesia glomerata TaxID=32391 RepID=A0AAV7I082_COTGL|nr:hypothetical protein KQX54_018580 [Cotesia glomerata]